MKKIILPILALILSTHTIASTTDFSCEITLSEYRLPRSVYDQLSKYPRYYSKKIDFIISSTMDGNKTVQILTNTDVVRVEKVKKTTVNGYLKTFAISFDKIKTEEAQSIVRNILEDELVTVSEPIRLPKLEFDLEKWYAMKYLGSTSSVAKGTDSDGEPVKYRINIGCEYPL